MDNIKAMLDQLVQLNEEMLKHHRLIESGAKIQKKTFDALVRAGFTPDQAILILAGRGTGVSAAQS